MFNLIKQDKKRTTVDMDDVKEDKARHNETTQIKNSKIKEKDGTKQKEDR